jgi:hypothetical protein
MKIPGMLHGRAGAVKSRAKKKLREVVATREFDRLDYGPLVDTKDVEGLLLVEGERFQMPGEHFHCYALTESIFDLVPASEMLVTMDAWMRWSLAEAWRFLGAVGQLTTGALHEDRSLLIPYVEAGVRFWPELSSEGKRYGPTLDQLKDAWEVAVNLKYALANLGIPSSELRTEPPGGPAVFLTRLGQKRT